VKSLFSRLHNPFKKTPDRVSQNCDKTKKSSNGLGPSYAQPISSVNKHIEDYLDYYCRPEFVPEYAVLLKGPWGAGKSWFIKRYCEKLDAQKVNYLYVTLYGISTFDEIEDAFFQQLHPILSSKSMAIAGKILKGLIRTSLKIDLDHDKKEDLTVDSQIPDIGLPDYFKNTQDCILIFDDLERCRISIEAVLGYINHFVEHQGLKVIIAANEEEIFKSEEGMTETERSYKRIKEKLVGKTFRVAPDLDAALANFLDNIMDHEAHDFLVRHTDVIKDLYSVSSYENLRHLKQALWDFERFFKSLPEHARKKEQLVKHILQLLLAFSFEIRHGTISPKDIGKLSQEYTSKLFSKEKKETHLTEIVKKYSGLNLYDMVLTERCWIDLFDKGTADDTEIEASVLNSRYYQDEKTPTWVKLWHYYDLTDEDFETLLLQVETSFKNKEYRDIGIIKHIVGLLMMFSDMGFYDKDKSLILQQAKDNIDFLKNNKGLQSSDSKPWDRDSYAGLGFAGKDLPEFPIFIEYITSKAEEAMIESMPSAGIDLLEIMKDDADRFYRMTCLNNSSDEIYYKIPIFKYIAPKQFVDAFLSLMPDNRRTVNYALKKRYELDDINKILVAELAWLVEVRTLIIEAQQNREGKLSGYMLKLDIEIYFDKSIRKLEKINEAQPVKAD
jgi:hypothetical protein